MFGCLLFRIGFEIFYDVRIVSILSLARKKMLLMRRSNKVLIVTWYAPYANSAA